MSVFYINFGIPTPDAQEAAHSAVINMRIIILGGWSLACTYALEDFLDLLY